MVIQPSVRLLPDQRSTQPTGYELCGDQATEACFHERELSRSGRGQSELQRFERARDRDLPLTPKGRNTVDPRSPRAQRGGPSGVTYAAVIPPSTRKSAPVRYEESSE